MEMRTMATLDVILFKNSYVEFIEKLEENGIKFSRVFKLSESPMAAGETIKIITDIAKEAPWASFAAIVVAWLKAKRSRKVIITDKENGVFHAEGYSVKEVEALLEKSKSIAIIDTNPNKET